jgi:V/A-type H+/Na+-transporting ATPase subunit I
MIIEMKKISMVVQTKDKESTLDLLGDLGLVHLEDYQCSSPDVDDAMAKKSRAETAYTFLAEFKTKEELSPPSLSPVGAVESVLQIRDDFQVAKERALILDKRIAELQSWGDFEPEDFVFLAAKGYHIKIYYVSREKLQRLDDIEGDVVVLRQDKKGLSFAHITTEPVTLEEFDEFNIPPQSLSAMQAEKNELLEKIAELTGKAQQYYALRPALKVYVDSLESNLQFWIAKANAMEEESLTAVVGYLPVDGTEAVQSWARQNSVAIAITDPDPSDPIPTLVRNPKWLEIVSPVFKFMGTVPGYQELDISLFFLCFFTIFFAMIIGDAAYGAVFFLAGLGLIFYSKFKSKKPPLAAWLFTCLGLVTVVWGSINGSWFGSPELIKGTFLEGLIVSQLTEGFSLYTPAGEFYKELRGQDVIMLLCFIIAIVHLTIAQVWNFLQALAQRSLRAVGQVGWMLINFGLFYLVLDMVMRFNLDEALGTGGLVGRASLIFIFGGLGLVVLFGSQEGPFFKGILAGIGGIPYTVLGSIGAFGDIISYVRLFAMGLAGAEIAKSFNNMASGLLSGNTLIIGLLILFIGHIFNFVLCSLGVLVHGIRLKMLEFSGRLGIQWSGHEYNPFSVRRDMAYSAIPAETKRVIPAGSVVSENIS